MSNKYIIPVRSGIKADVKKGQTITVIDIEGGQVYKKVYFCTIKLLT